MEVLFMLKNKYLNCALVLGLIGGISALLIGVANAITSQKIKDNETAKEKSALKEIYGDATYEDPEILEGKTYLVKLYTAKVEQTEIGFVYKAAGKNSYGEISLLVGINPNGEHGKIALVTNTESFASVIKESYVDLLNKGKITLDDVKCGATYGATLIKNMVNEAQNDAKLRRGQS